MKKFKITNPIVNEDPDQTLPFGLGCSWKYFEELIGKSVDIRGAPFKESNTWCSNNLSKITKSAILGQAHNPNLLKKRIDFIQKAFPTMELNSDNRIQIMNFSNVKTNPFKDNLFKAFDGTQRFNTVPRLIDVIERFDGNLNVDTYWVVSNEFMSGAYNSILGGYDGKIYHRPYPISTWVILIRLYTPVVYTSILKPLEDYRASQTVQFIKFYEAKLNYDEVIPRLKFIS